MERDLQLNNINMTLFLDFKEILLKILMKESIQEPLFQVVQTKKATWFKIAFLC